MKLNLDAIERLEKELVLDRRETRRLLIALRNAAPALIARIRALESEASQGSATCLAWNEKVTALLATVGEQQRRIAALNAVLDAAHLFVSPQEDETGVDAAFDALQTAVSKARAALGII